MSYKQQNNKQGVTKNTNYNKHNLSQHDTNKLKYYVTRLWRIKYKTYLQCTARKWELNASTKDIDSGQPALLTLYSIDTQFNTKTIHIFLKKLREKKKLLVMTNFFFSHNVFKKSKNCIPICQYF